MAWPQRITEETKELGTGAKKEEAIFSFRDMHLAYLKYALLYTLHHNFVRQYRLSFFFLFFFL